MSSEYNQRQYWSMLQRIEAYETGSLSLDALISDLEGLLFALENVAESWKQAFGTEWSGLEIARAIASSRGEKTIDEKSAKVVSGIVARLKLMVLNEIEDSADTKKI